MTLSLSNFELPQDFIKRFEPVRVPSRNRGLLAYLFDSYGLQFFRRMATAETIPPEAIWSICNSGAEAFHLLPGERDDAIGYIVTRKFSRKGAASSYPLPKRLSQRQKIQAAAMRNLIDKLRETSLMSPDEILAFIEQQCEGLAR